VFSSRSCRFMYSMVEAYDTFSGPGYFVVASSPGLGGLVVCVSLLSRFQLIWFALACLMCSTTKYRKNFDSIVHAMFEI
jgi:hypothetical protein